MWVNKDKNGNTYFGIGFQSMDEVAKYSKGTSNATPKPQYSKPQATSSDDLPF